MESISLSTRYDAFDKLDSLLLTCMIIFSQVKEVQAKFPGSTVNDILASVLTLTIRKYLEDKGDPVLNPHSQSLVRASFPLSMRSSSTSNNMKTPSSSSISTSVDNIFAMGEFVFDFKSSNGCDLVWGVKDQVDRIKASPQVCINYTPIFQV